MAVGDGRQSIAAVIYAFQTISPVLLAEVVDPARVATPDDHVALGNHHSTLIRVCSAHLHPQWGVKVHLGTVRTGEAFALLLHTAALTRTATLAHQPAIQLSRRGKRDELSEMEDTKILTDLQQGNLPMH